MGTPIFVADAFTDRRYAGNPAGVCFPPAEADAAWMQAVAREMNHAETAFLKPRAGGDGFDLRWFTPTVEMDLCGHATLASAHTLWESGRLPAADAARFHTRSGVLTCRRAGEWIEMDFPALPLTEAAPPPALLEALGLAPGAVRHAGKTRFDWMLHVEPAALVRGLKPDFGRLRREPVRGVIVTAPGDEAGVDFVSRFFAPAAGVDEDPVTGSAHCCLAPYWARTLGKAELTGYQASARGGTVRVRPNGERVLLAGRAVTTLRGDLA